MLKRNRSHELQLQALLRSLTVAFLVISASPGVTLAQSQITKTDPPIVNTPSTVGRIPKWWGVRNNGMGIIGDSIMTESGGNIGIDVSNPGFKLTVGGSVFAFGNINTGGDYRIGGYRILSTPGTGNTFLGRNAGLSNIGSFPAPSPPAFGAFNSFFGSSAGENNTIGGSNSFFGANAGLSNTEGNANSFFGLNAGELNTTGNAGSFFGLSAGHSNTTGSHNSFFGVFAGFLNTTATNNSFFGSMSGLNNTSGENNSFFGKGAGESNTTESNNTFIGALSNGAPGISNATALGANAVVTQSNSVVLGDNAKVGIGTSSPQSKLHVSAPGEVAGQFDGNVEINGNLTVSGTTGFLSTVIHDGTLSGAGTAGSPLSIVSAPNGVVTTGSYANPEWITSLDGNKLTAGTVVKSVNGITDSVTLAAGNNVTITPSGSTLTISVNSDSTTPQYNPNQIALLRWYDINRSGANFPTGLSPQGLAFDGAHIWAANAGENTISKIRVSDGTNLGTFAVGAEPRRVAFDGANIWVSNWSGSTVMKLRASDGQVLQTIATGQRPGGLAFDGTNMWVANYVAGTVMKLRISDGAVLGTFGAGGGPIALAFDGTNIWVANNGVQGSATKIRASDGALLGTFATESFPGDIAFDGSSVWITNTGPRSITKLRASDGAHQMTFLAGGICCDSIAFDGVNLWFSGESVLFKRRPSDGALLAAFAGLSIGTGVAFDGANIWVANRGNNSLGKF